MKWTGLDWSNAAAAAAAGQGAGGSRQNLPCSPSCPVNRRNGTMNNKFIGVICSLKYIAGDDQESHTHLFTNIYYVFMQANLF